MLHWPRCCLKEDKNLYLVLLLFLCSSPTLLSPFLCYFWPRACPEAWLQVSASKWETQLHTAPLVKHNVINTAWIAGHLPCGHSSNAADLFRQQNYWTTYYPCLFKFVFLQLLLEMDLIMRFMFQEAREKKPRLNRDKCVYYTEIHYVDWQVGFINSTM